MSANLDFENEIAAHDSHATGLNRDLPGKPWIMPADQGDFQVTQERVTALDLWIAKKMLQVVGNPPIELRLWDGKRVSPPVEHPVATLQYNTRRAMLQTIVNPELYFGDVYSSGQASFSGDLIRFTEIIYSNLAKSGRGGWLRHLILWLGHRRMANSHDKAKDNIYHHYDIGNDFYKLWLDSEEMQYTCAYFPAGAGAGRKVASCLPQAAVAAGRYGGRGRLRMGRARAFHGEKLRRQGQGLQYFQRTGRTCPLPG